MRDLAADADRVLAVRAQVVAGTLDDAAADAEIANAVRHLGQLYQDASRLAERLVHVPQRAGAAEARELEAGRAVALGDVAGRVDAHEVERHAARAGALQRAEAMRDLLEAGVPAVLQLLDVVPQFHRRAGEAPIRHRERAGRVVDHRDAGDVARGRRLESRTGEHLVAQCAELEIGELGRHLECAGRLGQVAVEGQYLRGRVVVADQARRRSDAPHLDPVARAQCRFEPRDRLAIALEADLRREGLGGHVHLVDVVVAVVEEVAYFLVRNQRVGRVLGAHPHRLVEAQHPLVERTVRAVQCQELPGQRRRGRDRELEFRERRRRQVRRDVGAGLAQVGDQPRVLVAVEIPGADVEHARKRDQHAGGDGPLVGLDLRQVAGRQPELLRTGLEGQALPVPQRPDLRAHE